MTAIDALPDGRLVRSRVVSEPGEALSAALDRSLTGYAVLEPQDALLLDADDAGVIAFEDGVPVGVYHRGTDRGGPAALADLAVPGPYSAELYAADAGALAPVTRGERSIPPRMAAERLAGDPDLADRTLAAARERPDAGTGPAPPDPDRGRAGPGPDGSPPDAERAPPDREPAARGSDRPGRASGEPGRSSGGSGDFPAGTSRSSAGASHTGDAGRTPASERGSQPGGSPEEGVPRDPAPRTESNGSDDRSAGGSTDREPAAGSGAGGADAVAAFLEDDRKIEAIRERARGQARERADEWGLTDHLADPPEDG